MQWDSGQHYLDTRIRPRPGEWSFIAITYDTKAKRIRFYLNGTLRQSHDLVNTQSINLTDDGWLGANKDKDLNVFKKHEANPVIKSDWDPHTWVENDIYYSIGSGSAKRPVPLYTCADETLTKWTPIGPFFTHEMDDVCAVEDIACPDFFKLGDKHVLLCISHIRGARYYVGSFGGKNFRPEAHYRMNWPGGTCFAPESLVDDKGRRIMWAWVVGSPSTMSLPRVLSMESDGILHINPPEELNTLRTNPQSLKSIDVPADATVAAEGIKGDTKELHVIIDPQQAIQCGVKVRCAPDGAEETVIAYEPSRKALRIEMGKSSMDKGRMPKTYVMPWIMMPKGFENPTVSFQEAPFELKAGELLALRIYLDHSILEVFANGRQCVTQRIYPTRGTASAWRFLRGAVPPKWCHWKRGT